MAEIVNLRMARKDRARNAKEREAQANRAVHGESKATKAARKADEARAAALLDGVRREPD
ncbi:DUF4169 family protein [Altererythrobacter sp. KTW20L]|uniref:DUF4169 family protein n=1 Tax=Altererythrobacter sp. KTW20L TaxID=2942210 RepID=UPI0020BDDC90|nr:DUF4169 family protein [Altererythrobacter sp. KTW20L]MCL6251771.1 DUF4169 family protein [Altererythrobacter sp. KTW20L]